MPAPWHIYETILRPIYVPLRRLVTDILFEWPRGTQTSREVSLEELGLAAEGREKYRPSGWLNLRRILPIEQVSENDVFIDFGSGKGRVIYQAARYPFKRVIGVELSEELNAIARKNIQGSIDRFCCKNVELITSDVLAYEIPDDITVAYLFNPFTGSIFRTLLEKLIASIERNPRIVRIVYADPVEESVLLAAGARELRRTFGMRPSLELIRRSSTVLYALGPNASQRPARPRCSPQQVLFGLLSRSNADSRVQPLSTSSENTAYDGARVDVAAPLSL